MIFNGNVSREIVWVWLILVCYINEGIVFNILGVILVSSYGRFLWEFILELEEGFNNIVFNMEDFFVGYYWIYV